MEVKQYVHKEAFRLESGEELQNLHLAYHTFGILNQSKTNVVWAFHGLTANSNVLDWWSGLFGENKLFDPQKYFIICVNSIGSPYGSSSPEGLDFPMFTVRDVVNTQFLLADFFGIKNIQYLIGGSFGGSQALEFAYTYKGSIDALIMIACAAKETAWGIAIHEAQRLALIADDTFGKENGGSKGLKAARAIGMLTYRTIEAFNETQTDTDDRVTDYSAASYINHQANKLEQRFNALSYYYLSKCLDSHNIGRNREGVQKALSKISCKSLVIGINSDQLQPIALQKQLAAQLPNGTYKEIDSKYGHDGFLLETKQIHNHILKFINHG